MTSFVKTENNNNNKATFICIYLFIYLLNWYNIEEDETVRILKNPACCTSFFIHHPASAVCPCSTEGEQYPGLHRKRGGLQGEGVDGPPLLFPCEARSEVLHSDLESPALEG